MKAFIKFTKSTRGKMNVSKSHIYFGGMDERTKKDILIDTGLSVEQCHFAL